jgi:uncharacterized protein (DUF2237 family)
MMHTAVLHLAQRNHLSPDPESHMSNPPASAETNVLGGTLQICSLQPRTGFYRTGCCETGPEDRGIHVVCAEVTAEFLAFSQQRGNDLSTPAPQWGFPGLKPGDRWCLCVDRWKEALDAGVAPRVVLEATHSNALKEVELQELQQYALPAAGHA